MIRECAANRFQVRLLMQASFPSNEFTVDLYEILIEKSIAPPPTHPSPNNQLTIYSATNAVQAVVRVAFIVKQANGFVFT